MLVACYIAIYMDHLIGKWWGFINCGWGKKSFSSLHHALHATLRIQVGLNWGNIDPSLEDAYITQVIYSEASRVKMEETSWPTFLWLDKTIREEMNSRHLSEEASLLYRQVLCTLRCPMNGHISLHYCHKDLPARFMERYWIRPTTAATDCQ